MTVEGAAGFVVTRRRDENPRYRGPYNMVPWSQEKYESGFDDPYVFAEFTDERGLIRTLDEAREVARLFATVEPAELLEIIYVKESNSDGHTNSNTFLGFDVAAPTSPFYSILCDNDFGSGGPRDRFASLVNENGLFDSSSVASDYLLAWRTEPLPACDPTEPLLIWEVYGVELNRR